MGGHRDAAAKPIYLYPFYRSGINYQCFYFQNEYIR